MYTLVSEIHENIDLVLGIKNVFQLEGVINSRDCCFKFLNIFTIFFKGVHCAKTKGTKINQSKSTIVDKISGLEIVKILSTMLLKLKFMCNAAKLDITNNGSDTIIFEPGEMLGILGLRSLSYYKIKQCTLQ